MSSLVLPSAKDVRDVLAGLLFRDITVAPGNPVPLNDADPAMLADYVDDRGQLAAVVVIDFALTAWAGAAIGLVPAGGAQDAVEEHDLPQSFVDNAAEVLSVLSSVLNAPGAPHVRLGAVHEPGEVPPADVIALAKAFGRRLDLVVDVAAYGRGSLSLVLA